MLTRAEATTRSQTVPGADYRIVLDFTGDGDTFRSTSTIEFTADAGAQTFVDLVGSPTRISLNGTDLPLSVFRDERIHLTDLEPSNTLTVEADCKYRTTGSGIHRFVDPQTQEVFLYSQFAVDDARAAFACFDQPDIKGTFTFTVTAPEEWEVISNTRAPEPTVADGARTWDFAPTVPLPCYVTAIVAGPFVYEEGTIASAKGEIPARVYGRPQVREHLDAKQIVDDAQRGFDLFERIFESEYPYDSYDQVYVPQFNFGAMENAGCVTISEDSLLFRTRVPDALREFRSVVVLHELAHMWFGNLVTMQWWDDLWLNESFAEFIGTHAASEVTEWADAWVTFGASRKSVAYAQDQLPTTHPVLGDIPTVDAVSGTFDMITYAKGASALRQLAQTLEHPVFFAGVAAYIRAHHHGNATLADLFAELTATSGRDLAAWSHAWLETPGVTTLAPSLTTDDAGVITDFAVTEDVPDGAVHHPHQLRIAGFRYRDGAFEREWSVDAHVDGARTEVADIVGRERPDLLLLNDDDLTYAKVRLDERSLATVTAHLADLDEPMAQYLVLDALWHMCRDAQLPAQQYVDAVLAALPAVTTSQVMTSHCQNIATAVQLYAPPAAARALAEHTAESLWEILQAAAAGSDNQLQLLRAFAALASTEAQADRLAALLDGSDTLPGLPINSEITWDLVTGLAACDRVDDADIDRYLAADPGAAGERRAAGARASIANLPAKQRAWDLLARPDGDLPANSTAYEIARGLSRGRDGALMVPMLEDMLATMRSTYESMDDFMGMRTLGFAFPTHLAGRADGMEAQIEQWLADNADAPTVLVKIVTEGLDNVRRALRAQGAATHSRPMSG